MVTVYLLTTYATIKTVAKLASVDVLWDRIVGDKFNAGDLYVNNERVISKTDFVDMLKVDETYDIKFCTYGWDDGNEKITMLDTFSLIIYEVEDDKAPKNSISGLEMKQMVSNLKDDDEVSFYLGNERCYPSILSHIENKVRFILKKADDQNL